jgi:hypothetical protein
VGNVSAEVALPGSVARIVPAALVALIGLSIGAATSFAQTALPDPWSALANAASPWLVGGFVAGMLELRRLGGTVAGLSACVLEVVAYYAVSEMRGHAASATSIAFWTACAVVGGPLFGWAGWTWWRGPRDQRSYGGALLPATFVGEGVGAEALRLHHGGAAVLYLVVGVVCFVVVAARSGRIPVLMALTVGLATLAAIAYGPVLGMLAGSAFGG